MLEVLNSYCHGYVAIPVILACKRKGLYDLLNQEPVHFDDIVDRLSANSGHLRVALRILESMDWISRNADDCYRVTAQAGAANRIPDNVVELLAFSPERYFRDGGQSTVSLSPWIDQSMRGWNGADPVLAEMLDGLLFLPLLLGVFKSNLYDKKQGRLLLDKVPQSVASEIVPLFVEHKWCHPYRDKELLLTDLGRFFVERVLVIGTVASYNPMLRQIETVIFGNTKQVFVHDAEGHELHVDRQLNVISSGFSHQRFFNEIEAVILSIFNQLPVEEQPRYVADMGCGDGTLLKKVYKIIEEKSERGKVLDRYPVTLIGVDYNQKALDETQETLTGIPSLVIHGDIGDPEKLEEDLEPVIGDVDQVLHLRSFLDHDRPFIFPTNEQALKDRERIHYQGVYVDGEGKEIKPHVAVQGLVEHFQRWGRIKSQYGLVVLEVHCLPPVTVSGFFRESENLHFDAYHAFSGQQLVEAEVFIMAAAEAGLFPRLSFSEKSPKYLPFTRITLDYFEPRDYTVRFAAERDIPVLLQLEQSCFPSPIAATESLLRQRLEAFPAGQMVLEKGERLISVVYSQRIKEIESLHHATINDVPLLHDHNGSILQLLSLNVFPEYQHQQLGDQLLDFMLYRATLMNGIESVAGVTRCIGYSQDMSMNFIEYVKDTMEDGWFKDPVLKFHQYHGAKVKGFIDNYRPLDTMNNGYGVLIQYELDSLTWRGERVFTQSPGATTKAGKIIKFLRGKIDFENADHSKTLVALGLDSLDFVELLVLLQQVVESGVSTSELNRKTLSEVLELCGQVEITATMQAKAKRQPLSKRIRGLMERYPEIVPLAINGESKCTFWIHPMSGDVGVYQTIAINAKEDFTIIGIKAKGFLSQGVEPLSDMIEIARYYSEIITCVDDEGPYNLVGFSFGGTIAYEIVRQLQLAGKKVANLLMVEAPFISGEEPELFGTTRRNNLLMNANFLLLTLLTIDKSFAEKLKVGHVDWADYQITSADIDGVADEGVLDSLVDLCQTRGINQPAETLSLKLRSMAEVHLANLHAIREYRARPLPEAGAVEAWLFQTETAQATSGILWNPDYLENIQQRKGSLRPLLEPWASVLPKLKKIILQGDNHFDVLHSDEGIAAFLERCTEIFSENNSVHHETQVNPSESGYSTSIAVIGMSGRFPDADNVAEFWENLSSARNSIREAPKNRGWDIDDYFDESPQVPGKTYSKWGGFVNDIDKFDPLFFGITPREAEFMDPSERIFLQESWRAIEDAGYAASEFSGKNCGVFAYAKGDYSVKIQQLDNTYIDPTDSSAPSRLSYLLNLTGPAMSIDTACSSTLAAIAHACDSLALGNCEIAIAGGGGIYTTPNMLIASSQSLLFSPDGQCHTFDKDANGTVLAEAIGVIVLKPLNKAVRDGDHIYGVIKGWGTNQDGKTNGMTAPSVTSQVKLETDIYNKFDINPETITLVEAHGTGTKLGDPIEVQALTESFQRFTQKANYCALGSVKANIGHAFAGSGITGIIKVLLSLQHEKIPPSLNFNSVNPLIRLEGSPFFVSTSLRPWERIPGHPRRAAVSSFGATGINAHLVLEEYCSGNTNKEKAEFPSEHPAVIVLSAKSDWQLQQQVEQLLLVLRQRQYTDTDIGSIAYTLQVGREAMDFRLAIIAATINELERKLEKVAAGNTIVEGVFQGEVSEKQTPLDVFIADDDLHHAISAWVSKRKYSKLLGLWVKGLQFDWNALYGTEKPGRISLPSYPFAKERYWLPAIGSKPDRLGATDGRVLHPLVQQNTSDLVEQRYSSVFSGKEFFLEHHKVQGQRLLPGVAYLEMACAAVVRAAGVHGDNRIILKNVIWAQPIVVDKAPVKIHVGLFPEVNGGIAYEIYSDAGANGGERLIHSQGNAVLDAMQEIPYLDIASLRSQCNLKILSSAQCYEAFRATGIDYGAGQQGLENVYVGSSQVVAKLVIPSVVADTLEHYVLHPSLLDSALQASVGLLVQAADENIPDHKLVLPFALQSIEVYGSCQASMWAWIRYSADNIAGSKVQKLDIDLSDDAGRISVQMKGFTARLAEGGVSQRLPVADGTLLLKPAWQAITARPANKGTNYSDRLVVLCGREGISSDVIESQLPGIRCISLALEGKDIASRYQQASVQLFETLQTLLLNPPKGQALVQVMVPGSGEDQLLAGLGGLLKTVALENPVILGQLIEMPASESDIDALSKLQTESFYPHDSHIRYSNGKHWLVKWREIAINEEPLNPWKADGVYLITGGLGGLGQLIAGEVVRQAPEAQLILAGRSLLSTDKQAQLESLGTRVEYRQVDVTQREAVATLLQRLRTEYGRVDGIIHCAGVIQDNFILKKSRKELETVMAPKVTGLVNLDLASRELELDFLIAFSSLAGSMGNTGQADYATANAFMDRYAAYRNQLVAAGERHGLTLAIAWPLWKDGGMHVDGAMAAMKQQSLGLSVLETALGIKALYQSLASSESQVMVVAGEVTKIRGTLLATMGAAEENQQLSAELGDVDLTARLNKLLRGLIEITANVLDVRQETLDVNVELSEYGFDTVTLNEFGNQVKQDYEIEIDEQALLSPATLQDLAQYLLNKTRGSYMPVVEKEDSFDVADTAAALKSENNNFIGKHDIQEKTVHYLKEQLANVIGLPASRIDAEAPMEKYGIDSIMVMRLTNQLEKTFGSLPKTLFFEYQNIQELSRYFLDTYAQKLGEVLGVGKKVNETPVSSGVINASSHSALTAATKTGAWRSRFQSGGILQAPRPGKTGDALEIAVIGLSGRYPEADNIQAFWENLRCGKDSITEIPKDRWDQSLYFDKGKNKPEGGDYRWGGFLNGVDQFDPLVFNIASIQANYIDPQERLFLQCVYETIEDAGYTSETLAAEQGFGLGANVGVYVGVMYEEYQLYGAQETLNGRPVALAGSPSSIANRVSYFFDFHGPSMAVDTMCSSSLTAIHLACQSLQQGGCELAVAGGVNVSIHPNKYLLLGQSQMLSSKGRCESFGAGGDGYVPGEGVGAVLLKPKWKAVEDGDHIYGVIRGTAINHGGKTNGYSVPNPHAQAGVIRGAFDTARVDPRTVSYIEAHGTGTSLGDPIEIAGLSKAFQATNKDKQYCAIGSAKSNIGHCESAAGIAGVTKVLLQMQHGELAPSLHAETLNSNIDFETTPFIVQRELTEWERPILSLDGEAREYPRIAGISSFGAGGSNAHVIIEEHRMTARTSPKITVSDASPAIIVLSAKSESQLRQRAERLLNALRWPDMQAQSLADIAYTLQVGREAMDIRLALVAGSHFALEEKLLAYLDNEDGITDLYQGRIGLNRETLSVLTIDDELQEAIEKWLSRGKYGKFLQLWVQGLAFDWHTLYGENKPQRISLPTYPFSKERYWYTEIHNKADRFVEVSEQLTADVIAENGELTHKQQVLDILGQLIGVEPVEIDGAKALLDYGVDSIVLVQLLSQLQAQVDPNISLVELQESGSIQNVIDIVERRNKGVSSLKPSVNALHGNAAYQFSELIRLNQVTEGRPVFWFHAAIGGVEAYQGIAQRSRRPFYGIQARGWMTGKAPLRGIKAMAAYYVEIITAVDPAGPYDIGGYSLGGDIAYEVARQLQESGKTVETIVMLDSLDSLALKKMTSSTKTDMLQAVNTALSASIIQAPEDTPAVLIHRDEVDVSLEDEPFLSNLLAIAKLRGLNKSLKQIKEQILQNVKVQQAYELEKFSVLPLREPQSVTCYYFRNKNGLFMGQLSPYFSLPGDETPIDHSEYWREWQQYLPNFEMIDIDASNHMVILSELVAAEKIYQFCENLYGAIPVDLAILGDGNIVKGVVHDAQSV
ncbi:MAG: SDR family NAD(P)-dependent oxidoreductase [Candidatus Thiodiazotropha sp. (ex Dulcina madagascariensis)]|nr:SDR family NAD(P)-dependent oxidoreductase [Candidatus Thiodiazotropha sp. (ex Dulcina madagascariensis)]